MDRTTEGHETGATETKGQNNMTHIEMIQRVRVDGDHLTIVGPPIHAPLTHRVESALDSGLATRAPVGPGWGSHNALVRVGYGDASTCFSGDEPEYGDWLCTIMATK